MREREKVRMRHKKNRKEKEGIKEENIKVRTNQQKHDKHAHPMMSKKGKQITKKTREIEKRQRKY